MSFQSVVRISDRVNGIRCKLCHSRKLAGMGSTITLGGLGLPQNNFIQKRLKGHSKWQNIKFKKAIVDHERSKVFGKVSLEIIQSVKENGGNPDLNHQLQSLITKAKSLNMPKDKIEQSIEKALRGVNEARLSYLLQARGPGKCGLMIDILSPNVVRCKNEVQKILRKNECTYIEDGSVAFMFQHKGVLNVEKDSYDGTYTFQQDEIEEAEEVAIMIGAEDVKFIHGNEDERKFVRFFCPPLQVYELMKELNGNFKTYKILSAEPQYIAKTLTSLSDQDVEQNDRIIELLSDHPDVLTVYDNIDGYSSKTIKLKDEFV